MSTQLGFVLLNGESERGAERKLFSTLQNDDYYFGSTSDGCGWSFFPVNVWNVHEWTYRSTNNPLERFNRELNAAITAPHPRLSSFVGMIEVLSQRYVRLLDDITNRRAVAPQQGVIQVPVAVDLTRQGTVRRQGRAHR
ncbi:LOW QUALITY PROTEIN: hypothetical protein PHMEG_00031240 [Phytophthora megakarya]|uniref:Uncharacterized protein n=1 Tax=Phytophthora megakarya TaxID=4795 RepID=A0A225UZ95_9STRA|nr:LOW QUALITY PROTEIN: hypothetical protein PHMEG_00031240 [Phytophthora megakarya]